MPIGMIEGFDYYPDYAYAAGIGVASTWIGDDIQRHLMRPGRFEGKSLGYYGAGGSYSTATRILQPTTKCGIGFAFRTSLLSRYNDGRRIFGMSAPDSSALNAVAFHLWINNVGIAFIIVNGVEVARSTRQVLQSTWVYFEIELDIEAKRVRLLMDGLEQFNVTNPALPFPRPTVGRMLICGDDRLSHGDNSDNIYDDMYYVYDEARTLGESRIQLGEALANDTVEWTPLAGQNWENIDEISVDSDTTYNATNTVGAKDLFKFTDIVVNPDVIHAVGIVYAARKEDSGTRTVQSVVKSGGVEQNGFAQNMTTDYIWTRDVLNLDPQGNVPWTKARVNALRIGYRLVL